MICLSPQGIPDRHRFFVSFLIAVFVLAGALGAAPSGAAPDDSTAQAAPSDQANDPSQAPFDGVLETTLEPSPEPSAGPAVTTGRCLVRSMPEIDLEKIQVLYDRLRDKGYHPELTERVWDENSRFYYLIMGRFERNADAQVLKSRLDELNVRFIVVCRSSGLDAPDAVKEWESFKPIQQEKTERNKETGPPSGLENFPELALKPPLDEAKSDAGSEKEPEDPVAPEAALNENAPEGGSMASNGSSEGKIEVETTAPESVSTREVSAQEGALEVLLSFQPKTADGRPPASRPAAPETGPDASNPQALPDAKRGAAPIKKPPIAASIASASPVAFRETRDENAVMSAMADVCWKLKEKGRSCEIEGEAPGGQARILAGRFEVQGEAEKFVEELRGYGYRPEAVRETAATGAAYLVYVPEEQLEKPLDELAALGGDGGARRAGAGIRKLKPQTAPRAAPPAATGDAAPEKEAAEFAKEVRPSADAAAGDPLDALYHLQSN